MIWKTKTKSGTADQQRCHKKIRYRAPRLQDWPHEKQISTAPSCSKTIVDPHKDFVILSQHSSTFYTECSLIGPRPSPALQLSLNHVNFIDKFRMETSIENSIYNAERWLPRVSLDWLKHRNNPGLLGRHRMDITKHGLAKLSRESSGLGATDVAGEDISQLRLQMDWSRVENNQPTSRRNIDSNPESVRKNMIPILVEQCACTLQERAGRGQHQHQPDLTKDWHVNGYTPRSRQKIIKSKSVDHPPPSPPAPARRDLREVRKMTSLLVRNRTLRLKRSNAANQKEASRLVDGAKVANTRQFQMEIDDASAISRAGRDSQRRPMVVTKALQLPAISRPHHDERTPDRSRQQQRRRRHVDDASTRGVSVWGYKQTLVPPVGRELIKRPDEFLIQHTRPLVTTPVTPSSGARSRGALYSLYENGLKPWTPMRFVSDTNSDLQTPPCLSPIHKCPSIYNKIYTATEAELT